MCRCFCRSSCCSKIWWFILTQVCGWTFVDDFPDEPAGVFAMLPHTSNWDFTLAPLLFVINASITVKSSLSFLLYFGFPVHPVVRGKAANQTKTLGESLKKESRWLAIWVGGTRKFTEHISSGFYYIAKDADVPIRFAGVDWRNKTVSFSKSIDPKTTSKDDVLSLLKKFSEQRGLQNAGYIPQNASILQWRLKKEWCHVASFNVHCYGINDIWWSTTKRTFFVMHVYTCSAVVEMNSYFVHVHVAQRRWLNTYICGHIY